MKKKICLFLCIAFSLLTMQAQLVVNNNGQVIIGAEEHHTSVSDGGHNPSTSELYVEQDGDNGMVIIADNANQTNPQRGISLSMLSGHSEPIGIYSYVTGTSPNRIKGIHGHALGARYNMGVVGTVAGSENMFAGAGIFGANTSYPVTFTGVWAGYFYGNVKVIGHIYGTMASSAPTSASNASFVIMNDEQHGISDRLRKIDLLQWEKEVEENNEKKTHVSYGLAADQVKEVFPELVIEDENGATCINYVEMVPLLVQTIKELNTKIEKLESKDDNYAKNASKAKTTGIDSFPAENLCSLSQNEPNPFTTSTSIQMSIASSVHNASLRIFDMTGKQVRNIQIDERGDMTVSLSSENLTSGIYIYTLIADGNVISSKRMIIE